MSTLALAETYLDLAVAFLAPELEEERQRIFGHVISAECPPYETQWGGPETFQQAQQLADVAGFYAAWGVREARAARERPDYIAIELEFAGFLAWKEALAEATGEAEDAATARAARRRFHEEHLGRWAPFFATRLEERAGEGPFADAARHLGRALALERSELGVEAPTADVAPRAGDCSEEGACFECGS